MKQTHKAKVIKDLRVGARSHTGDIFWVCNRSFLVVYKLGFLGRPEPHIQVEQIHSYNYFFQGVVDLPNPKPYPSMDFPNNYNNEKGKGKWY